MDKTIHPANVDNAVSQVNALRQHLLEGNSITGLQAAMLFGIGHLPRRILDLKESGLPIASEFIKVEKSNGREARVKKYFIC